jgi:hypothetical protein
VAGWVGGVFRHVPATLGTGPFHMQWPYRTWLKTSLHVLHVVHKALLSHRTRSFPGTSKNVACWRNLALGEGGRLHDDDCKFSTHQDG